MSSRDSAPMALTALPLSNTPADAQEPDAESNETQPLEVADEIDFMLAELDEENIAVFDESQDTLPLNAYEENHAVEVIDADAHDEDHVGMNFSLRELFATRWGVEALDFLTFGL